MKKMWSRKPVLFLVTGVLFASLLAGCGSKSETNASSIPKGSAESSASSEVSGTVTASGSSALLPLVKAAAAEFSKKNSNVTVNVTAGGSGTGLKNVADGISDIGNSDVEAGDEYKDKNLVDHVVSIAPFALIVNKDVEVENLSKQQAADIFSGKVKNWKELGGKDQPIVIVNRPDSSGSRKLIKTLVLGDQDFTKEGVTQESSGAMKTAVSQTTGAIGYVDIPYVDDAVKMLKFEGVEYKKEGIKDGSYKLYGVEHMYTKGEPKGVVKAFLEYIMSAEFQNSQVEQLKFLPASTLK
ncbi:phosphate ABC transporter, phosphate-binding protein [Paenibacillus larvae subsp. larvae]|uniref:Phosphate-binding protein n=1 Tax=Paenibacillus larvae subsp. larvae TaxID=147375 RepID=A0A2L1UAX9_9BACL|nr:phosphate ABC transporter substrate-binding protein [Paenibacillus larvae]AQT85843.1 phosphate-binding protein [Paenibacillus larvae subsp. pulvifaciens]AQZ45927.1 phosphate-binding protein [Paenibacillus larvae subsp. pulvifaciens]AVF25261.1 phosphate ABC transporter, phosphate-binding protein [Paenibacillus larvae subsp. larvae]AVF30038.1 phosphate ABC transporter, phosphate-binding protein [Paenibacillus larvae subsp. larvae]MBH0344557.1 phosphate-binding protein [Paenibacillus larvae]